MNEQSTPQALHNDLLALVEWEQVIAKCEAEKRAADEKLKAAKKAHDELRAKIDAAAIATGLTRPHPLIVVSDYLHLDYNPAYVFQQVQRELTNRRAAQDAFLDIAIEAFGIEWERVGTKLESLTPSASVELRIGNVALPAGDLSVLTRAYNAWHLSRDEDGGRLSELVRTKHELNADAFRKRVANDDNMEWADQQELYEYIPRKSVRIVATDVLTITTPATVTSGEG